MLVRRNHASETAYFLFEPITLRSKHREVRPCAFESFLELLFELSERISHNIFAKHFSLKSFEYFPFKAVLSDVQGVLTNSPCMLLRAAIARSARLPST